MNACTAILVLEDLFFQLFLGLISINQLVYLATIINLEEADVVL